MNNNYRYPPVLGKSPSFQKVGKSTQINIRKLIMRSVSKIENFSPLDDGGFRGDSLSTFGVSELNSTKGEYQRTSNHRRTLHTGYTQIQNTISETYSSSTTQTTSGHQTTNNNNKIITPVIHIPTQPNLDQRCVSYFVSLCIVV